MTTSNNSRPPRDTTSSASRAPAIPLPMITRFRFCDTDYLPGTCTVGCPTCGWLSKELAQLLPSVLAMQPSAALDNLRYRTRRAFMTLDSRKTAYMPPPFSSFKLLNPDRADLELRHAAHGVERSVGQAVDGLFAAPVERDENRVFAGERRDLHFEGSAASPRHQFDRFAVAQPVCGGRARMNFGPRVCAHFPQLRDAPRLRARLVLRQHAARRQKERVFGVSLFVWRRVAHGVKSRPPARRRKRVCEEAWRARMRFARARPVDALIGLDLLPRNAGVISHSALRRAAQLIEYL